MSPNPNKTDLKAMEKKCRLLENQCSDYINTLEQPNRRLEKEIRKQKRTESRLKISKMRFRKIFEHAPFSAAIADREGSIVLANHALCRMLGYSQQEMQRMHIADITHKEDVDADMERFRQLIDGAIDHYNLEKRYHTKQNKVIWGSMAATLIHGRNPQERSILGMVEDISERKRAEQKIIQWDRPPQSRHRLCHLQAHAFFAVWQTVHPPVQL